MCVGRDFEAKDLLNNTFGILAGLLIPHLSFKANPLRYTSLILLFVTVTFIALRPLLFSIIYEIRLWQDFPVLSDFETPYQINHWRENLAELSISKTNVRDGRFAMRAVMNQGEYPSLKLRNFHTNWEGYESIEFSVYLDSVYPMVFIVDVYDKQHPESDYSYDDRFKMKLSLNPGWNDFSFPLSLIENAPKERSMDMKNIVAFTLYKVSLKQTVTVYVDSVWLLEKAKNQVE